MERTQIGIFDLARRRMAWAEQRQAVLAKNIANANTPKFQPADVPDFARTLSRTSMAEPLRTQPNHMGGTDPGGARIAAGRPRTHSPDGNAVVLDQQLMKVADTVTTQALTTSIYKKYMGLFSIALGRAG